MPVLPNLPDIPQVQFDRIVASFPGTTNAEKVQAYQDWLTNRLLDRVEVAETTIITRATEAQKSAAIENIRSTLPARRPEPVYP